MKTLTKEEFERLYGKGSTQVFTPVQPKTGGFDFQASKDVFARAGSDVSLAQQNQQQQNNSLGSTIRTGATMAIQGGLSIPRAIGAGIMGTETAQNITGKAVKGLGDLGEVITPDVVKKFVGQKAMQTIEGYNSMSPQEQLNIRNQLGAAEVLSYFLGSQAIKEGVVNPVTGVVDDVFTATAKQIPKTADDALRQGKNLRQSIQSIVGEKSVEPQFKASAERAVSRPVSLETTKDFLKGTGQRTEDVVSKYNRYLTQSEQAINDIKVDPAISEVGSKMGDAFEGVIKQRQAVGKVLGSELKEWGKLRVSVQDSFNKIIKDLDGSGLSYNPRTRQLTSFQGSKFAPQEVDMLNNFIGRMRLLGDSPSVNDIDNFVSRMRTELDFTKGASGVMKTTNAERIINGGIASLKESLDPSKNGIKQLTKYWNANKTYSQLSDFVEEGATYLGKKTQSGDFAKDASIAKSAVQSILNNGKKDWMLKLEALTGYNALDDAVIALQAMKDAGDFRGLSLLQAMKDGGIPTSKAGIIGSMVDYAVDTGKRVVAGKPSDQTRAFLKSLEKGSQKVLKAKDGTVFERAKGLSPELEKIEEKAFLKITEKEDEILKEYFKKNGKIINTDNFRPFFKDVGYNGTNARAVQEPSSYLSKKAYTQALAQNRGDYVAFTAGGSGTGKTSALKGIPQISDELNRARVVVDSNFSSYSSAVAKIKEALGAGQKVVVDYVYRDPLDSFENGVVKRMLDNPDEMGRLVPSEVVAGNHIDSLNVVKRLRDDGLDVRFVDNSLGAGNARLSTYEDIVKKADYPTKETLASEMNSVAERLYKLPEGAKGKITKEQYEGYIQ